MQRVLLSWLLMQRAFQGPVLACRRRTSGRYCLGMASSQMTIPQAFAHALQQHQAGRLAEAEAIYRQILVHVPDHPDTLHLLGMIAHKTGHLESAADLIRRAIAGTPGQPAFHSNLGNVLLDLGQPEQAIACYEQALAIKPDFVDAANNLGSALMAMGRPDGAIASYQRALAIKPEAPETLCHLGNAFQAAGRLAEAVDCYTKTLALKPDHADAYFNMGKAFWATGRFDEAAGCYRRVLGLRSHYPDAHFQLGNALLEQGRVDEAIACYQQALALKPDCAPAFYNMGNALKEKGRVDEAIAAFQRCLSLDPSYHSAYNNLGNALQDQGRIEEAIACYEKGLAVNPHRPATHSNLLLSLHYRPGYSAEAIFKAHRQWNQQHAEAFKHFAPHVNDRSPDRRLKIGYVSADLREHVIARFLLPLLRCHDHTKFEVYGYAHVARPDAMTERLRSHTDQWRSLVGLSDQEAADVIRQDGIDILVDLAGHTGSNRLLILARKPAPVQVTWLGYPDTTGLDVVDYRLTDALADPPGLTDAFNTEQLVRLPQTAWCLDAISEGAAAQQPPSMSKGYVTFGTFSNFAKVSQISLGLWTRILQAVPRAHLRIKAAAMANAEIVRRLVEFFGRHGIAADRVELVAHDASWQAHLQSYDELDIALDTFPYHGTTTTCEALWMGVPVVSLAGATHVSRVGASLLTNVGLGDLVAPSEDEYVQIAAGLAQDQQRLGELRSKLRQRMQASPLMDAPGFARNVEAAYRQMWRQWCAGGTG